MKLFHNRLSELLSLQSLQADFKRFKSKLMELGCCLVQTLPDIACLVRMMAIITDSLFNLDRILKIQALNKLIRMVNGSPHRGSKQLQLVAKIIHIRAYADGSSSNHHDLSSPLGYIIFLSNYHNDASVLDFRTFKSLRVIRSVLGAEVCSFVDAFDNSYALQSVLKEC